MPDFNLSTKTPMSSKVSVGLMAAFSMSHIVLVVCALCALAFLCGLLYREALPELEA